MRDAPTDAQEARAAVAKAVVDHLISIASGLESEAWMAKYIAVQKALECGRLTDAVREESRLTYYTPPMWVVSRELDRKLKCAMGNLARELQLPNPGEKEVRLDDLPADVTEHGTVEEEKERRFQESMNSIVRDPLEKDERFVEILKAASAQAKKELADHPHGCGFCHTFWERKKEILRRVYRLVWQSPADLNPNISFH